MTYIPFSGDITELILKLAELAEDDPILGSYMEGYDGESLSSLLSGGDFTATVSGAMGTAPDLSKYLIDFRIQYEVDGEAGAFSGRVVFDDPTADPCGFTWNSVSVTEGSTDAVQLKGRLGESVCKVDGTIVLDDEDDSLDEQYQVSVNYQAHDELSNKSSDTFSAAVTEVYTGMEFEAKVVSNPVTYETHADLSYFDQLIGITTSLTYAPDETPAAGTASSGMFEWSFDDGYVEDNISCRIEAIETTIDAQDYADRHGGRDRRDGHDRERIATGGK